MTLFMSKPPKRPYTGKPKARDGGRSSERPPSFRPQKHEDFKGKRAEPRRDVVTPPPPRVAKLKADLFGLHAVREAWGNPARFVHALYLTDSVMKEFGPTLLSVFSQPTQPPTRSLPPREGGGRREGGGAVTRPAPTLVTKDELDRAFPPGTVHQGIALSCQPLAEASVMDIIIKGTQKPRSVVVVLDQVTDPHNIGAVLRSACAFGADGVVMQSKHAPEMTGILAKTACGALEHIAVAYETNLSRALEKFQESHYTVIGLDEHAEKTFSQLYKYDRVVIVLGAEGTGMRRLVKEHCDVLVKLPTQAPIASLNVSNAAAVALYALLGDGGIS